MITAEAARHITYSSKSLLDQLDSKIRESANLGLMYYDVSLPVDTAAWVIEKLKNYGYKAFCTSIGGKNNIVRIQWD